ncbi:hypothetical protein BC834DRAFT_928522 [Gloeopeniophorella convolvens]|nr:hypothetical protein BC834DRAFT_928522 [Gloeopeniophorella convolvens]
MPRFLTGDELGNIKALQVAAPSKQDPKSTVTTLYDGSEKGKAHAVQKMAIWTSETGPLLAAARSDGSASVSRLQDDSLELVREWTEPRLKTGPKYIGLAASSTGVYSCTSNGALRLTPYDAAGAEPQTTALPMRLCDWRLAPDAKSFAYGGDEVELSVWDLEAAFASTPPPDQPPEGPKKRKRGNDLLPGETWRAKNVANDTLSLRRPVHNTCLAHLGAAPQHLLAGTQRGDVRRYDTRAARRPVAEWAQLAKGSGIGAVAAGFHEHEVFVADQTSGLFAVDTRNGRVVYGYKGLAGAITAMAPAPTGLVSTALDRYARVHSTHAPPAEAGQAQDEKGAVLEKVYMKSVPTAVVWDGVPDADAGGGDDDEREGGDDGDESDDGEDVWEGMEEVGEDSDEGEGRAHRRRKGGK